MTKVEILGLATGVPRTELAPGAGGDPAAARSLLTALFPGRIGDALPPADLLTASRPEYGRVYAGVFGGTAVVCGQDLLELTDLADAVRLLAAGRTVVRLKVNSVVDSAALEILGPDGDPARELMLVGEQGVIVDEGAPLEFERPFWSGERDPDGSFAVVNGTDMPFDVIDFGQEALRALFGFGADDDRRPGDLDARRVLLHGFVIAADAADPSDISGLRSPAAVPDVAADPTDRPRTPPRSPRDDDAADGARGGRRGGTDAAVTADAPAGDSVSGSKRDSWWSRLLDRLFG